MKEVLDSNIYEFNGIVIICSSCLENMDKVAYKKIKDISENIFCVCLEKYHMNMILSKLSSVLRVGRVNKLVFVTVDKSPHCIQLHYISNELRKLMNLENIVLTNFIASNGDLFEISQKTISLSKNLKELSSNNL
jgi:hypothetical protein